MGRRSQRHKQELSGSSLPQIAAAWIADANTKTPVAIVAGNARCERLGTANPRISKLVAGLLTGATYRVDSVHTMGTAALIGYCRVAPLVDLTSYIAEIQMTTTGPYTMTFICPPGGFVYIGVALGSTVNGDFCQTKDAFTVTRIK